MHRYCSCCGTDFNLQEGEISARGTANLPLPDWCTNCRLQLKLTFVNHRSFHTGACTVSGVELQSVYHPQSEIRIVAPQLWWADETVGLLQGREFDFSRRFFEQFRELSLAVPKPGSIAPGENVQKSDLVFDCSGVYAGRNLKDCYASGYCDDSSELSWAIDCLGSKQLDHCIECIDSENLKGCTGMIRCSNVTDSDLCVDCHDSEFLLLCWNLTGKRFCILNRECTQEEFFHKKLEIGMLRRSGRQDADEMLEDIIFDNIPPEHRRRLPPQSESEGKKLEQLLELHLVGGTGKPSIVSSCIDSIRSSGSQIHYSHDVHNSSDIYLSELCFGSSHLFGCSGLREVQYAIFNRSYNRHEYEQQIKKLIGHMRETGEWGQFFPAAHSPFAYNESLAQQYYPLTQREADEFGFAWREPPPKEPRHINGLRHPAAIPDEISEVSDKVLEEKLDCARCNSRFRLLPPELFLYRTLNYPVPSDCPDCRYQRRLEMRPVIIVEAVPTDEPAPVPMFKCIGA